MSNHLYPYSLSAFREIILKPTGAAVPNDDLRREAEALFQRKDWVEASKCYQLLIRQFPDDAALWQNRLECFYQARQKIMVRLVYQDALREHPEWENFLSKYAPAPVAPKMAEEMAMA